MAIKIRQVQRICEFFNSKVFKVNNRNCFQMNAFLLFTYLSFGWLEVANKPFQKIQYTLKIHIENK